MKLISFLATFFLLTTVSLSSSFAQTQPVGTDTAQMPFEQEEREETVSYVLPYPGMLPNNPLYFLKELRDGLIGFLIQDPLQKAEFDLLQADKHISAAEFLVKEHAEQELALQTTEKAQREFADAIVKIKRAKEQGVDTQPFLQKLFSSAKKHEEVLSQLFEITSNNAFAKLAEISSHYADEVEKLQPKR